MKNKIIYDFLSSFFEIFNAYINEYKIEGKNITGKIRWNDDIETQDFSFIIELNESAIKNIKLLCEYLVKNNLINGDRIIIKERELQKRLTEIGWNVIEAQKYIDILLSVEIKMIDDREETDSFFIHF